MGYSLDGGGGGADLSLLLPLLIEDPPKETFRELVKRAKTLLTDDLDIPAADLEAYTRAKSPTGELYLPSLVVLSCWQQQHPWEIRLERSASASASAATTQRQPPQPSQPAAATASGASPQLPSPNASTAVAPWPKTSAQHDLGQPQPSSNIYFEKIMDYPSRTEPRTPSPSPSPSPSPPALQKTQPGGTTTDGNGPAESLDSPFGFSWDSSWMAPSKSVMRPEMPA